MCIFAVFGHDKELLKDDVKSNQIIRPEVKDELHYSR